MSSREYNFKLTDCFTRFLSACEMYNVLLCRWQYGLITRDSMEETLRLNIRPVLMRDDYHGTTDTSDYYMNGLRGNGISPLWTDMKDFWGTSGKQAQDFSDPARWYEEDEYGEWHDGYWQGETWVPEGYGGMIHVNESLPTEVSCNLDNRSDAFMRQESYDPKRRDYDAAWMMDWNYDWIANIGQWGDMRSSGSSGQFIDWAKAGGTTMVAFANSEKHGESLYDSSYWRRVPDGYESTIQDNPNSLNTISIRISPVNYSLDISYIENYNIDTVNYTARRYQPIDSHSNQEMWGDSLTSRGRTAINLPKEMMFRVERYGRDRFLILAFSKALYVSPYGEFGSVKEEYYADLLASGRWDREINGNFNRLVINIPTLEPIWQLSSAWIYESLGNLVMPAHAYTHVFSSYSSFSTTRGLVAWQNDTSDLYITELSHKVSNLVDYSDVRSRGMELQTHGITVANNDETELYTHGRDTDTDTMPLFCSAPIQIVDGLLLYMPVMDEQIDTLPLQIDGGGKQLTMPLYIGDLRVNDNIPLYIPGKVGELNLGASAFVYDDTTLQNFINDTEWQQWSAPPAQMERWDDQVTYTKFDVILTNATLPAEREHYYKKFGENQEGYFQRDFQIEFIYQFNDMGVAQAEFMPFIIGEHVRWPELFAINDPIMSIKVDTDGLHTLERHRTAESESIGSLVDQQQYYCRFEYGPITPYGQSLQFVACQVSFWTSSAMTGTPAFTAYHRMDDVSPLEKYDDIGIGAAVSAGTYSFMLENLWISGSNDIDSVPLMTHGHAVVPDGADMKLLVTGLAYPANSYTTLQVFGGSMSGSFWTESTQNLFLYHYPFEELSMPLVVFNNTRPEVHDGLPLYIGGVYPIVTDTIPLTLWHDMGLDVPVVPLWIAGYGTSNGYNHVASEMLCYVNRPDQSINMPLLVYNDTPGSNSYMNLRISGIGGIETQGCTLVMPNVMDGSPNSFMKLQMTGAIQVVTEATLAMPDVLGKINAGQPLICYHSGGAPNSYVTAFIDGVYKSTGYTTLAMPNVHHIPTQTASLYIRGY